MEDPSQSGGVEETEKINVVPLADLTLVLLIILMVLSPMISQSMIHVATPAVKAEKEIKRKPDEAKPLEPLIISITKAGYFLNNAPTKDLSQLMRALEARLLETPDRPVLVTAEDAIKVGEVVEVLDLAKLSGAERVSLLKKTAAPEAKTPAPAKGGNAVDKRRQFIDAPIAGVNIVPVIDLCLVLLVILLILSPMLDNPPVQVKLPQARTEEEKENNIALTVAADGRMALNTDTVAAIELPKRLNLLIREQGEDVLVVIRSDKNLAYGKLTELLRIAKDAGAKRLSLGTEQPTKGPKG